ncbi:MAG: hypothetical protein FWF77_08095, partial [Defluviitaleaceae bacterium]|nr:hypothetical protein [Defluviitaleaceae bacterium]
FPRSRKPFPLAEKIESASVTRRLSFAKKARQARSGHRGPMSAATHSLEAGCNLPEHKKIKIGAKRCEKK